MKNRKFVLVSNTNDNVLAGEISRYLEQESEIADIITLKSFVNGEFCPKFTLGSPAGYAYPGESLHGTAVIIVSADNGRISRNELAMRNLIISRAARENGAEKVILLEPDLIFSSQDKWPGGEFKARHGSNGSVKKIPDFEKYDGQAYTARLYAQLLRMAGVDMVITIHNHSDECISLYEEIFGKEGFFNIVPDRLFHSFISESGIVDPYNTVLVAPDEDAADIVISASDIAEPFLPFILFEKVRYGDTTVNLKYSQKSQLTPDQIEGKELVIIDDILRTGSTILECTNILRKFLPFKIVVLITHFFSSDEVLRKLGTPFINEIVTTDTIPSVLNPGNQGRLRNKMTIMKTGRWIAYELNRILELGVPVFFEDDALYTVVMGGKNPRARVGTNV